MFIYNETGKIIAAVDKSKSLIKPIPSISNFCIDEKQLEEYINFFIKSDNRLISVKQVKDDGELKNGYYYYRIR